jgi:hypothetical protein
MVDCLRPDLDVLAERILGRAKDSRYLKRYCTCIVITVVNIYTIVSHYIPRINISSIIQTPLSHHILIPAALTASSSSDGYTGFQAESPPLHHRRFSYPPIVLLIPRLCSPEALPRM